MPGLCHEPSNRFRHSLPQTGEEDEKVAADEPAQDVRAELLELADDYDRIASLAAKALTETNDAAIKAQRP